MIRFINVSQISNKVLYWHVICLFIISTITILILSTSTSFLYSYYEQLDSIVFQQIGKEWLNGVLPYRDIWDLKGPLIFLLNAIELKNRIVAICAELFLGPLISSPSSAGTL